MARPVFLPIVEVLKPLTWFAPMWAFACGVVSSGIAISKHWPLVFGGLLLAGPMVCGTSQAVNDWFDRHVDAVNEPNRPIPSGRLPGNWGFYVACLFTLLSLGLASALGRWAFIAAIFSLLAAWAYSAPPFRFKRNGWLGNAAVGLCYEGVPWFTGTAIMIAALPGHRVVFVALLYSIGAHGIMTLNDFKSEAGDRKFGIRSLPVQLGAGSAAWVACFTMAIPQIVVIGALINWGQLWSAFAIAALLILQFMLMRRFLSAPRAYAVWYNATGTSLYVLGMLIAAFALRADIGNPL